MIKVQGLEAQMTNQWFKVDQVVPGKIHLGSFDILSQGSVVKAAFGFYCYQYWLLSMFCGGHLFSMLHSLTPCSIFFVSTALVQVDTIAIV